jgi:hypothetical protein
MKSISKPLMIMVGNLHPLTEYFNKRVQEAILNHVTVYEGEFTGNAEKNISYG